MGAPVSAPVPSDMGCTSVCPSGVYALCAVGMGKSDAKNALGVFKLRHTKNGGVFGLLASESQVFEDHYAQISALAWAQDSERTVSADASGVLLLWKAAPLLDNADREAIESFDSDQESTEVLDSSTLEVQPEEVEERPKVFPASPLNGRGLEAIRDEEAFGEGAKVESSLDGLVGSLLKSLNTPSGKEEFNRLAEAQRPMNKDLEDALAPLAEALKQGSAASQSLESGSMHSTNGSTVAPLGTQVNAAQAPIGLTLEPIGSRWMSRSPLTRPNSQTPSQIARPSRASSTPRTFRLRTHPSRSPPPPPGSLPSAAPFFPPAPTA